MDDDTKMLAEYRREADVLKAKISRVTHGRRTWQLTNVSKHLEILHEMYNDCLWSIRELEKRLSRTKTGGNKR